MTRFSTALMRTLILVMLTAAGSTAAQQAYPSKPIRIVVPYPPAGSTDPMARMVAQKLAAKWGQPVIVDNRPGGNTIIGTEAVAKAPPDGYTLLLASPIFVTSPGVLAHLPYDTGKDFAAVATIGRTQLVLVLNPTIPVNNLKEFIALAKTKPGQLNFASTGVGGIVHLSGELFNIMAGTKLQHIPYKGALAVMTDLMSGQVDLSFQTAITSIPFVRSGKVKAIAITGEARSSSLPQVPTYSEAGLPGYGTAAWFGIVAPAGTHKGIVDKLSSAVAAILAMPDTQEYMAKQGVDPYVSTPGQFAAQIKSELAMYAKVVKTANIRMEQ